MKHDEPNYERIPMMSDDGRESLQPIHQRQRRARRCFTLNWGLVALHASLISLYSLASLIIINTSKATIHASEVLERGSVGSYSPAAGAVRYRPYIFNAAPDLTSPYVGESRPSLDREWHELIKYTNMRVSGEDLERVNRTSIPLGVGGGYLGEIAVFHELHCLVVFSTIAIFGGFGSQAIQKFMRQAFHMSYYGDRFGEIEKENMGEHTEHCIELLRQGVMCRGDTTLITFGWGQTVKLPQPDFTLEHECVDWDHLMEWAGEHAIDVFEDEMLVHPTLGPSYPGGWREDRPHSPQVNE